MKRRRFLIALAAAAAAPALLNVITALMAAREISPRPGGDDDPWLYNPQTLEPDPPAAGSVILLHGFGGSPYDMKPLAEALRAKGFRAVVPVLPGETRSTPPLRRGQVRPEEYVDWIDRLVRLETARTGRPPALAGFSMGGSLALLAARGNAVERLVLVAPYFGLARGGTILPTLAALAAPVVPLVPKPWSGRVRDPAGARAYRPGSYLVSLRAVARLEELAATARRAAAEMGDVPLLVAASPNDPVASFSRTAALFSGRSRTTLIPCSASSHVILYDYDAEAVIDRILAFLEGGDGAAHSGEGVHPPTSRRDP